MATSKAPAAKKTPARKATTARKAPAKKAPATPTPSPSPAPGSLLEEAVIGATQWAVDGAAGQAQALAHLARQLAREITGPSTDEPLESLNELLAKAKGSSQTAALAKELRATLVDLEALRDNKDADAGIAAGMSTPVWDTPESGPPDAGTTRRRRSPKAGQAPDAVAAVRGRRGAGAGA